MRTNRKKYTLLTIIAIVILLVGGFAIFRGTPSSSSNGTNRTSVMSADTSRATASATVDKTFTFKAINQAKATKDISFTITEVERKTEIRVKGETRKAPRDFDYLLVRIEMENTLPERLAVTPADLVRLEDDRGKLFSPDYHNGNVILDAISVKKDLLSFLVNKNTKKFVFQVGELNDKKEKVEINF